MAWRRFLCYRSLWFIILCKTEGIIMSDLPIVNKRLSSSYGSSRWFLTVLLLVIQTVNRRLMLYQYYIHFIIGIHSELWRLYFNRIYVFYEIYLFDEIAKLLIQLLYELYYSILYWYFIKNICFYIYINISIITDTKIGNNPTAWR